MLGVWKRPNVPQYLCTSGIEACRVRLLGLFAKKFSFPRKTSSYPSNFCAPTGEILRPREENIFL